MQKETPKKPRRVSLSLLLISALIVGFILGTGGSLLLTHSLIKLPLQDALNEQTRLTINLQQQLQIIDENLAKHQNTIQELQREIDYLVTQDSSSYISSLYKLQKAFETKEAQVSNRLTQVEDRLQALERTYEDFGEAVEDAKKELDAVDRSLSQEISELNSSLLALEEKVKRIERRGNY